MMDQVMKKNVLNAFRNGRIFTVFENKNSINRYMM